MTESISALISDPVLVTFTDLPDGGAGDTILIGKIKQDHEGRFTRSYICSSLVDFVADDIVKTVNSYYQIEGECELIDLPWFYIRAIHKGFHPRSLRQALDAGLLPKTHPDFPAPANQ